MLPHASALLACAGFVVGWDGRDVVCIALQETPPLCSEARGRLLLYWGTRHGSILAIIHHGGMPRMALNIKDPAIHALARELAQTTGESLTQAVRLALQERLRRVRAQQVTPLRSLVEILDDIAVRCAALPDLDTRSPDDILGYDAQGLPH